MMKYKVKMWIVNNVIICCSQRCEHDCPNLKKCKEVYIFVKWKAQNNKGDD
jgi:hypothetical protein